jgi:hypothetical protein
MVFIGLRNQPLLLLGDKSRRSYPKNNHANIRPVMNSLSLCLIAAYALLLLVTMVYKGPVLKGPWFFLLRSFLPNWKFFHAVGHVPCLYVRTQTGAHSPWSEWELVYPRRQRHFRDLFHNAETNLLLAQQNLVDHFWADLMDLPDGADARQLVSFAMVNQLALNTTLEHWPQATQRQFELRMVLSGPHGPLESETMLTTPALPCTS